MCNLFWAALPRLTASHQRLWLNQRCSGIPFVSSSFAFVFRALRHRMSHVKCVHLKRRSRCAECGGGGGEMCPRGKQKFQCKSSGGKGICMHNVNKHSCRICVGSGICQHGTSKRFCVECGGNGLCVHGKNRSNCSQCNDFTCSVEGCHCFGHNFTSKYSLQSHVDRFHSTPAPSAIIPAAAEA